MEVKHHLVITLPEDMADVPIYIVKGSGPQKIVLNVCPEDVGATFVDSLEKKYALIWKQNSYAKVAFDDILWIKAEGSYCTIRLTRKREMTVSFHLAVVEKELPVSDFARIHRSYIVNLKHVESLIGNCLKIEDVLLTIGREYREKTLDRFVFLGVRRNNQM